MKHFQFIYIYPVYIAGQPVTVSSLENMDDTNPNPDPNRPSRRVTTTRNLNVTDMDYKTFRREVG